MTVWWRASGPMTGSHVAELPVMPWMSTSAGPAPAVRTRTRWP